MLLGELKVGLEYRTCINFFPPIYSALAQLRLDLDDSPRYSLAVFDIDDHVPYLRGPNIGEDSIHISYVESYVAFVIYKWVFRSIASVYKSCPPSISQ